MELKYQDWTRVQPLATGSHTWVGTVGAGRAKLLLAERSWKTPSRRSYCDNSCLIKSIYRSTMRRLLRLATAQVRSCTVRTATPAASGWSARVLLCG